jgi:hypothetical protein
MWGGNLIGFYRKKFRQPLARTGWWIIVVFLCWHLRPRGFHRLPWANTMDLSIARRGPGFKIVQLAKINPSGTRSTFCR